MSWTESQVREFGLMLLAMGEAYETPVSTARMEIFCRALEDLPFEGITEAANTHIRTSKFFPRPADLRDLVLGSVEDQAELAWQATLRQVSRVGYLGKPTWTDPVAQRAAQGLFGSWRTLCERLPADGPELLGYRKQFVALYQATARQALQGALPPSRTEAKTGLDDLLKALEAQGLPTGKR